MFKLKHYFYIFLTFILLIFPIKSFSDNHNLNEIIKLIQKDLKTLERAVYSENFSLNEDSIRKLIPLIKIQKKFLLDICLNYLKLKNNFKN